MYEYKATIVKVVDGDTVDVDIDLGFDVWLRNQRIRLYGIDTPECRQRNKAGKAHGLLAKAYVQKALIVGRTYALTTKEKGKFGRFLGEFKTGKGFITKLLVKERLAVPYTGQNKKEIAVAHEINRQELIKQGMLTESGIPPVSEYEDRL
jgi:micrococcal nuclease